MNPTNLFTYFYSFLSFHLKLTENMVLGLLTVLAAKLAVGEVKREHENVTVQLQDLEEMLALVLQNNLNRATLKIAQVRICLCSFF